MQTPESKQECLKWLLEELAWMDKVWALFRSPTCSGITVEEVDEMMERVTFLRNAYFAYPEKQIVIEMQVRASDEGFAASRAAIMQQMYESAQSYLHRNA